MFLHLGNGVSVRTRDVIAISDYALFQDGPGKELLDRHQAAGLLVSTRRAGDDTPIKSLILTKDKTYLSVISPLTLKRRSQQVYDTLDNDRTDEIE